MSDPPDKYLVVTCAESVEGFETVATETKQEGGTLTSQSNQSETSLAVDASPENPRSLNHEVTCVGNSERFGTLATGIEAGDNTLLSDQDITCFDMEVTREGSVNNLETVAEETKQKDETYRKNAPEQLSALEVRNANEQLAAEADCTAALSMQSGQSTERSKENGTDDEPIDIRRPGPGWRFNVFLDKISEDLKGQDFKRLKSFFRHAGLGKAVIEKMSHPLDLFDVLKERGFIHFNDLTTLQGALYHLNRIDLVKECVEYARRTSGTIYIYSNKYQPENGYKYVKFHIAGRDFLKKTDRVLKQLKYTISELLFIPPDYIYIVGVDNTQSLLVTVMIREDYILLFLEIMTNRKTHSLFWDLHIDMIHVEKQTFKITGGEIEETDQEPQVSSIYQQLEDARKQLQDAEVTILEQSQEIKRNENELAMEMRFDVLMVKMLNANSTSYGKQLHLKREQGQQNYDYSTISRLFSYRLNDFELFLKKTYSHRPHANALNPAPSDRPAPFSNKNENNILARFKDFSGWTQRYDMQKIRAWCEWKAAWQRFDNAYKYRQAIFTWKCYQCYIQMP